VVQGYADGLRGVRLSGGKTRYGQWPFEPRLIKEDKIESSVSKPDPSQLPPPFAGAIDQVSVEVAWQASPEEDNPIAGYELEVKLVDALLGSQTWRSFHKGSFGTKVVGSSRAITALRARVRAYRSGGARGAPQMGPWSKPSPAMRLHAFQEATKVEIAEIPGDWAAVDVAGIEEFDERKVDPEELVLRKQALLSAMHEHRMVINSYSLNTLARLPLAPTTRSLSWPSVTAPLTTPLLDSSGHQACLSLLRVGGREPTWGRRRRDFHGAV
jgi:hypothetical protein